MAGDLRIRRASDNEFARVADLTLAAYGRLDVDLGAYEAELADVAGRVASAEVLVAVRAGTVLGAVTYVADPDSGYAEFDDEHAAGIRMLAVAPEAQGAGVGAMLVDACIARAAAGGRRRIVLHTTAEMTVARQLYERRGFRRAPQLDWQPRTGVGLLGYVLEIVPIPSAETA